MRTRSQGLPAVSQPGSGQIRDASGGGVSNHNNEERSSLQFTEEGSADIQSAAQSEAGFLLDMEEPVLTVSDRRIRKLVAETNMEKMRFDTVIKDLDKQATRHQQYQADGEDSAFLIERACHLKRNMHQASQMEHSLVRKLCNLTSLLEMLNLEGDEEQKKKGKELSSKVAEEIERFSGRVETFHHENKATLLFALT